MFYKISFSTLLISLFSTSAMADEFLFPGEGRATLSSTLSNYGIISGDMMHPLYGNRDHFLYGNMMGSYSSDDSFVLSPGVGIRGIRDNQLFGARMFADYARTESREHFLTFSPGIEWMNPHWDASANAYMPTARSKLSGPAYADGNISFLSGTHNQYNDIIMPHTVIGNGLDASVGYSFSGYQDARTRVYGGSYFYEGPLDADNILGVTAGMQMPLSDRLSIAFMNSYDQVNKYTAGIKISISIGANSNRMSNDVHDRAYETAQRHIGIIDSGTGAIAQQAKQIEYELAYDNVYFLSSNGTGDGTFGNAANLSQTTLDLANTQNAGGARIYLQGGAGSNYVVDSTTAAQSTNPNNDFGLALHNRQNIYGRSADYKTASAGNAQPQIQVDGINNYNGFLIEGIENTISDVTITTRAGYINGTTPTTSTGIVAYNTSATGNQTINIINTNINGLADGMYAQNNSNTGTLTINATNSTFNNNGGDLGIDNIQFTGYNNYGAAGLIAINNSGASNGLVINAFDTEFNNNGTFSGDGSSINNSNFSVASGMLAINNSDTGALTLNATRSNFDNNGTLSGDNTYLLANEAGVNGNSINTAAATGLYARNNSTNNGALTISANNSSFNNNGTLSGINSLIQAGGTAAGSNVNSAVASGIFAFNNTTGSSLLTINAVDSEFNSNSTLSGENSRIFTLADNASLGASESSAAATGIFAYNNTANSGELAINASGSHFDNNGALSGDNATIFAHSTNLNNMNETVASAASGIVAYNANNQSSSTGNLTVTADDSTFNGNGALSGNNAVIQSLNDNGFITGSASIATTTGLFGYNTSSGNITIEATNSLFNENGAFTGTSSNILASGADSNVAASSGFFVVNNSAVGGNIFVNSLAGSGFNSNGVGTTGYGIFSYTPDIIGTTIINYTSATFSGPPQINTNQGISDGETVWVQ